MSLTQSALLQGLALSQVCQEAGGASTGTATPVESTVHVPFIRIRVLAVVSMVTLVLAQGLVRFAPGSKVAAGHALSAT